MGRNNSGEEWDKVMVETLAYYRHEWLNHLQILQSYFKMGRCESATSYIRQLSEGIARDSHVSHLGYPPLVSYLLTFNSLNPEMKLEVEIPEPFKIASLQVDASLIYEWVQGMIEIYKRYVLAGGEANHLLLTIVAEDFRLFLTFDFAGNLQEEACKQELQKWLQTIERQGGKTSLSVHNQHESVTEISVGGTDGMQSTGR